MQSVTHRKKRKYWTIYTQSSQQAEESKAASIQRKKGENLQKAEQTELLL
jgi:hypothetical protein